MNIREKIKELPLTPGVYFMKNAAGEIIYVGKSKKLKNRVSSYFQKSKNHSPKIEEMVKRIDSFDYITTDTELEALLLECEEIKRIKPQYNSQMKNDKKYPFIMINVEEDYPRPEICLERFEDGALYFGPFSSLSHVEAAIDGIIEYFGLRKCSSLSRLNSSLCLHYELSNCPGVCQKLISREAYHGRIIKVAEFLEGKDKETLKNLKKLMEGCAERLDFEGAVKYRDYIEGMDYVVNKVRMLRQTERGKYIIALEVFGENRIKVFFICGHRLLLKQELGLVEILNTDTKEEIIGLALKHFSGENTGDIKDISKEDVDRAQIIYSYIKGSKNNLYHTVIYKSYISNRDISKLKRAVDQLILKLNNKAEISELQVLQE